MDEIPFVLVQIALKGIFDPYVLWPFDKKLISSLVTGVRTRDYTISNSKRTNSLPGLNRLGIQGVPNWLGLSTFFTLGWHIFKSIWPRKCEKLWAKCFQINSNHFWIPLASFRVKNVPIFTTNPVWDILCMQKLHM